MSRTYVTSDGVQLNMFQKNPKYLLENYILQNKAIPIGLFGESVISAIPDAITYLTNNGGGRVYVPSDSNHFELEILVHLDRNGIYHTNYYYNYDRYPTTESRPWTGEDWQVGDTITNNQPNLNKCNGWVCTEAGTPGNWTPFGWCRKWYTEIERVDELPDASELQEGRQLVYNGIVHYCLKIGDTYQWVNPKDGATFIPYVSEVGVISWTNDRGRINPDPVNIKGPKGDDYVLTDEDKALVLDRVVQNLTNELVQSDFQETDTDHPAYIKNKPAYPMEVKLQYGLSQDPYHLVPFSDNWSIKWKSYPANVRVNFPAYGNGYHFLIDNSGNILYTDDLSKGWDYSSLTSDSDFDIEDPILCYGNGIYIIVGTNTPNAWITKDLINWTSYETYDYSSIYPENDASIVTGIVYCNGRFVVVYNRGEVIATSEDGETWDYEFYGFYTGSNAGIAGKIKTICASEDTLLASGSEIYSSIDGKTWNLEFTELFSEVCCSEYINGKFVLGCRGCISYVSKELDSYTYDQLVDNYNSLYINKIAYLYGRYYCLGYSTELGTHLIYSSLEEDPKRWFEQPLDTEESIVDFSYSDNSIWYYTPDNIFISEVDPPWEESYPYDATEGYLWQRSVVRLSDATELSSKPMLLGRLSSSMIGAATLGNLILG